MRSISNFFNTVAIGKFTEPNSNVAPRIAGERYDGGKLIGVARDGVVALDCAMQGSPVPVTRYIRYELMTSLVNFFLPDARIYARKIFILRLCLRN